MMQQTPQDNRPPISPQLAVRVAIFGGVAFALFAVIFFRLWFLQVLSGDEYLAQARTNRVRSLTIQAPRGNIVDRDGRILVENRNTNAIQIEPQKLPAAAKERSLLYARLARVLEVSHKPHRCRVGKEVARRSPIACEVAQQQFLLPYANVLVKRDATRAELNYLLERQQRFPGVTAGTIFLRDYPKTDLAAQLFGTVGEVDKAELEERKFRGVKQGTVVGKDGIERAYDRYLRGVSGASRIQVDALGEAQGFLRTREPEQGKQLKLSLDLDLQKAGQDALGQAIGSAAGNGARSGAFVAMDPRNGEILAMGSAPSFDPNAFSKPITEKTYKQRYGEEAGAPLVNRAITGLYPTGSTFKVITATAALQSGVITPDTVVDDPGLFEYGNLKFFNAGKAVNGAVNMRTALQVSSDVYFYKLGAQLNPLKGQVLQTWARRLGLGRPTGVDLPGETKGLVPSAKWRNDNFARFQRCFEKHPDKRFSCAARNGFADRPWAGGDNVNLAVGQGDLQATPLQMAVAYGAIANGGRIVKPHLGLQVEDNAGRSLQAIEPEAGRRVDIAPQNLQAIRDGLHLAASAPGGTSADVFQGWPQDQYPVFGKTGTAERPPQPDQSWYVAYVPNRARPIVVAATVEKGGFGAEAAAPAVRLILSQWFGVKKEFVSGKSRTR